MTSEAAGLKEWIAGLQLGDRIAVLYDDEPGGVLIQVVTDVVEPGCRYDGCNSCGEVSLDGAIVAEGLS